MKYKYPIFIGLLFVLLSACSVNKLETKAVVEIPSTEQDSISKDDIHTDTKKSLSILDVYAKYSPTTEDFSELFKQPLAVSNERYQKLLKSKLKKIDEKFSRKQLAGPRLIYLENISTRKHMLKKEWIWGEDKKDGIKRYYKQFKSSWKVHEYKVAYQLVDKPKPKKMKAVAVKPKKKKKTLLKTEPTKANIVLYFYRLEGKSRIYIIDPDIFMKSML